MPFRPRRVSLGCAAVLCSAAPAIAQPSVIPFQTHAAFFSAETKQPAPVDPQVFVADASAPAATGLQGIRHAQGLRNAAVASDPPATPLLNADGKPLGFTLGQWLGAGGTAALDGSKVTVELHGLRPGGHYSLFENHFDQKPVGFTPLDGSGSANGFTADAKGDAGLSLTAPARLTHDNAVLVILDDDGQGHGASRGAVGIDAQHQLIARPPG